MTAVTRQRSAKHLAADDDLCVPDVGAPWGGRKASGMGRVYGPEGLDAFLATKCVFLPGSGVAVGYVSHA